MSTPPTYHVLLVFLFPILGPVTALPTGTSPSAPAYVPDPPGRGTIQLLTTCLVTLLLCVWTAIHLNILPKTKRTRWGRFKAKLKWAALALFAPEIVVWRAYSQLKTARYLRKQRNALFDKYDLPKRREWSLPVAFYASMGGLEITIDKNEEIPAEILKINPDFKSDVEKYCVLTPYGVEILALVGLLPDFDDTYIADKTKADSLAKLLVCIQAVWMLVQTIVRKAYGLPVTLLELNTLCHVGCAVLMYAIWWFKPKDVNEPQVITIPAPVAYFLHFLLLEYKDHSVSGVNFLTKAHQAVLASSPFKPSHWTNPAVATTNTSSSTSPSADGEENPGPQNIWNERPYSILDSEYKAHDYTGTIATYERMVKCLCTEAANISDKGTLGDWFKGKLFNFDQSLLLLAILGLVYGGVHLTSWDSHFPSYPEQWLWRVSGCIIASGGLTVWFIVRLSDGFWIRGLEAIWSHWTSYGVGRFLLGFILRICLVLYVVARTYIVVEAFISLRSLPAGAYDTVSWSNVFPHIG